MKVIALFKSGNVDDIEINLYETTAADIGVKIFTTSKMSKDLKDSAKTGIADTFTLLRGIYSDKLPNAVCVNVKGFSKETMGNSSELAFAIAFAVKIFKYYNLGDVNLSNIIAATGVIDQRLHICKISGIKEKLIGAIKNNASLIIYPKGNENELKQLKIEDEDFSKLISRNDIRLVSVESLKDALVKIGLIKENVEYNNIILPSSITNTPNATISAFNNTKNEKVASEFKRTVLTWLATVLVITIIVILFVLRKDVSNAFYGAKKNMPMPSISITNSISTTPSPLPSDSVLSPTLASKTTKSANPSIVASKNTVKSSLTPNQKPLKNLIINPDIGSKSDWLTDSRDNSAGAGSFTNEEKYDGNQCLKVVKTNNIGVQYHYQRISNPTGGGLFTYSAFIKTKNVSSNGALIWVYLPNGEKIFSSSISGNADWQKVTLDFTVPSEMTSFDALVGSKGTGTAYFDNIALYRN